MRYFFVDYENVNSQGLEGCEDLKATDKVYIMYSENANTLKMDKLQALLRSKASIDTIDIKCLGPNALDFQLCVLLGSKIGKFRGSKLELFIVSNDHGYDSVKNGVAMILFQEMQQKNIELSISRICNFKDVSVERLKEKKDLSNIIKNSLKITNYKSSTEEIIKLYNSYNNLTYRQFHNLCVKKFGEKDGRGIYLALKQSLPLKEEKH